MNIKKLFHKKSKTQISDGCQFCKEKEDGSVAVMSFSNPDVENHTIDISFSCANLSIVNIESDEATFKLVTQINYCPHCGKKLREVNKDEGIC